MTSYLKLYQDFLQKKDSDVKRRRSTTQSLPDGEEVEEEELVTAVEEPPSSIISTPVPTQQITQQHHSSVPLHSKKLEVNSYIRDNTITITATASTTKAPSASVNGLAPARTILVRRPPKCSSCHTHPLDEHELCDVNEAMIPSYNEIQAKEAMNECGRIAKYVKNFNPDDDDWESRINQFGWASAQEVFFQKVVQILNEDQLGRLANLGRQNEPIQRRAIIDKSAARLRQVLASISWDSRLTQWLHCLFMEYLPSTYMASYLDMLQALKSKVPRLMDKMLFGRPLNVSQELLAPVMKKKWEPQVNEKLHKTALNAVVVALPALPISGSVPKRLQNWYEHLSCMGKIVQVTLPMINNYTKFLPLEQLAEQIVSLARVKIQELRNENPSRCIILVGFNAGASLALQVGMTESVACIVCMGFAYHTINGVRGTPDDRILDIKAPILFVIGQDSQRTSQEEIESLREKMQSDTGLVIVGGADDALRISNRRRQMDSVTQGMVDLMVADEVYEYVKKIMTNPPGPRLPMGITNLSGHYKTVKSTSLAANLVQRKRKADGSGYELGDQTISPKAHYAAPVGRPRTRPLPGQVTVASVAGLGSVAMSSAVKQKIVSPSSGFAPLTHKVSAVQSQGNTADSLSNDELSRTMQSLLNDTEQSSYLNSSPQYINVTSDTSDIGTPPQKILTNYELVAQSKATPLQTTFINSFQKPTIIGSAPANALSTTNLKMIPSNHFAQLKPATSLQSQSKIYTINPPPKIFNVRNVAHSSVTTAGGQQIFALKSANGGTQRYTVVKSASGGLQLATTKSSVSSVHLASSAVHGGSQMDLSNIDDMPILFADKDGNLSEAATASTAVACSTPNEETKKKTSVGQLIISQKIIKEATVPASSVTNIISTTPTTKNGQFYINKGNGSIVQASSGVTTTTPSGANNVVYISRNTMRPCIPAVLPKGGTIGTPMSKYAKVLVTNPKTSSTSSLLTGSNIHITSLSADAVGASTTLSPSTPVKHLSLQALKPGSLQRAVIGSGASVGAISSGSGSGGSIISFANKTQFQIINSGTGAGAVGAPVSGATSLGDKPIIRSIVVKPGSLKQIPPHLTSQLINRNLTVRKVNIVPAGSLSGVAAASASSLAASGISIVPPQLHDDILSSPSTAAGDFSTASTSAGAVTSIQTAPKVITLNPINPSKAD